MADNLNNGYNTSYVPMGFQPQTPVPQQVGNQQAIAQGAYNATGYGTNPQYNFATGASPSKPIPTPAVVTPQAAQDKLNTINGVIQTWDANAAMQVGNQAAISQGMKNANAEAKAKGQPEPNAGISDSTTGSTGLSSYLADAQKALDVVKQASKIASENYQNQVKQLLDGSYPMSPQQQIMLDQIQQSTDRQVRQQEEVNAIQAANLDMGAVRSGRQRYTADSFGDEMAGVKTKAIQRVTDIKNQGLALMAQTKQAFLDKDYELLTKAYDAFNQNQQQMRQGILDLVALNNQAEQNMMNKLNYNLQVAQQASLEKQRLAENARQQDQLALDYARLNQTKAEFEYNKTKPLTSDIANYEYYRNQTIASGKTPLSMDAWDAQQKARSRAGSTGPSAEEKKAFVATQLSTVLKALTAKTPIAGGNNGGLSLDSGGAAGQYNLDMGGIGFYPTADMINQAKVAFLGSTGQYGGTSKMFEDAISSILPPQLRAELFTTKGLEALPDPEDANAQFR